MTKIVKGYKFRIYPNKVQRVLLENTFGCCRFVWNHLLAEANTKYDEWKQNNSLEKPNLSFVGLANKLPDLKQEQDKEWLSDVSSVALQQKVKDLAESFTNFFRKNKKKKSGYPQFKKKGYN